MIAELCHLRGISVRMVCILFRLRRRNREIFVIFARRQCISSRNCATVTLIAMYVSVWSATKSYRRYITLFLYRLIEPIGYSSKNLSLQRNYPNKFSHLSKPSHLNKMKYYNNKL